MPESGSFATSTEATPPVLQVVPSIESMVIAPVVLLFVITTVLSETVEYSELSATTS